MRRNKFVVLLLIASMLLISLASLSFAKEKEAASPLLGTWKITHRPLNDAGVPCPFLPESMQFFKDQTLVMSNFPGGVHLPYKTDLSPAEKQAFEKKSESFKGKSLLLVKPNPNMDWTTTPMVYIYSVNKNELTLTATGWEPATFRRAK
jgi:hypothetical protein